MMLCKPLDEPLSSLHPDTPVYVVRYGLVYVYPANLLLDIANDRYVPVDPGVRSRWPDQMDGRGFSAYLGWQLGAGPGSRRAFDVWCESATSIFGSRAIAAARYAAEHLINFETFRHRHLPDGGYHRNTTTG